MRASQGAARPAGSIPTHARLAGCRWLLSAGLRKATALQNSGSNIPAVGLQAPVRPHLNVPRRSVTETERRLKTSRVPTPSSSSGRSPPTTWRELDSAHNLCLTESPELQRVGLSSAPRRSDDNTGSEGTTLPAHTVFAAGPLRVKACIEQLWPRRRQETHEAMLILIALTTPARAEGPSIAHPHA